MEIAFQENSRMSQGDLAFKIEAVNIQMREHWAPAYLDEPWPCKAYKSLVGLPAGSFWPLVILDKLEDPGVLGFHDFVAGLVYGRVTAESDPLEAGTESHEAIEMRADPRCSTWLPMPDGRRIAYEMCDPCQGDTYTIAVTIGTETRAIKCSDFVLPSWFVPGAPGPYSFLDSIDEPFGLSRNGGGWRLIMEKDGKITSDFGRHGRNHHAMAARAVDTLSRTYRRGFRG